MEDRKALKISKIIIMGMLAAFPFFGLAYEPETTHKALTQEIIKVFNVYYPALQLSNADKSFVEKGSVDEDNGSRALNHFYDPVYNRGIFGNGTAIAWAEDTASQAILDPGYTGGSALAAVSHRLFDSRTDYSWDRAIYDYVWEDKARGLQALGHILHLMEDMSVPDHTRNDAHPPYADKFFHQSSPYESWADKWNVDTIAVADKILSAGEKPKTCGTPGECFDSMAIYSNNNFFSKDTMPDVDSTYVLPKVSEKRVSVLSDGIPYLFGYSNGIKLAWVKKEFDLRTGEIRETYFLNDPDNKVLTEYWTHLSKQAVLHGAGVVRLFFEEAEKERGSKKLWAKNGSLWDRVAGVMPARLASVVGIGRKEPSALISEIPASAFALAGPPIASQARAAAIISSSPLQARLPDGQGGEGEVGGGIATRDVIPRAVESENLPLFLQLQSVGGGSAGFGGGGDTTPPPPPEILSHANGSSASTTRVVFSGTAEKESVISSNFDATTAIANAAGNWALGLNGFAQGSTTIKFFSTDKIGNKSDPASREIFIDSIAPSIHFNISQCNQSLASDGCVLSPTALQISWSSADADLDHFEITCEIGGAPCSDFSFSPTATTSTAYVLPPGDAVYVFKARSLDKLGNASIESVETVEVVNRPVVINEVAWAGTAASANDEWIELYNRTSKTIDLSQMKLKSLTDNKPNIGLSGTIPAGGYYLIERTNDAAVSDVAADLTASFGNGAGAGLVNTGEVLAIDYKGDILDQTVLCSGAWCGGSAGGAYPSMERIDPEVAGTDAANWGTSNGVVKNGLDFAGNALTATPRARNSLHYLISQTGTLSTDKTLKKSFGTYIIKDNETLTIASGKILTIEPGVTVKMGGSASLEVNGTLIANGTSANNIIFTSLSPPNYWKNIRITSTSQNSSVSYAKFKYGGYYLNNTPLDWRAEFSVINNSISVSNSVFENSYSDGLRLTVSNSTVTGSTFSVGTTSSSKIGLEASDGSPTISQNTFSENYQGLRLNTNTAANVDGNTFTNNLDYAVYAVNAKSAFSSNSGSGNGNGKNGIALIGTISAAGGTTTLSANPLPYLIGRYPSGNPKIAAGSVLVVGAGTVWKGEANDARFEIDGTMKLDGASKDSILFTSLADSGAGEWYGITLSSTGYVYGGGFALRYGGGGASCSGCAGFSVIGGRVNLSDGRTQNNYKVGMQIYNSSTSTLSNFEFMDHQTPAGNSTALVSSNSTLILDNLVFSNNFANTSPPGLY